MRSPSKQPPILKAVGRVALLLVLWSAPVRAESTRQATIIARVFSYDYKLKARAGESLVIAVLFKSGDAASESAAQGWFEGFKALVGTKVQGLPLSVVKLAFTNPAQVRAAVAAQGIDVLLVSDHLEAELGAIKELSRSKKLMTVAGKEAYVPQGLTLGVFADGERNQIEVNLTAARAEDVSFSSDLLRLAKIIK